ncbi:TlpA disulfide reductase family protein [Agriterribacter sp.]|jgi:thiol-disulfide isomerase/thioredoxin|uniref:TlpA family protein disulfide reductase n=1 Tax=Agriterribacter sp. TaxID=2821509 RepID=UPI002CDFC352|nr:TlpA disulfide reductase family protein [Agriterribacter sp.]HRO46751.1 TlpA disulfide reductase family protein [Agriterribacter sp.]
MKYYTKLIGYLLILLIAKITYSQSTQLKIGDTIPLDIHFQVKKNGFKSMHHFSDFKGKAILIIFWNKHCVDCLAEMPEILNFQEAFQERLEILLVTTDDEADIQKHWEIFERRKVKPNWVAAGKQLSIVAGDKSISQLFPHKGVPTHVWIDRDFTFKHITYSSSTSKENIALFIENKPVRLDEINYKPIEIDNSWSWIESEPESLVEYSLLMKRIDYGAGGGSSSKEIYDSAKGTLSGIMCLNKTMIELYKVAYRKQLMGNLRIPDNRIQTSENIIENSTPPEDFSKYFSWAYQHTYCYAAQSNKPDKGNFYLKMRKDLDDYFDCQSKIENKVVKCLILKKSTRKTVEIPACDTSGRRLSIQNGNSKDLYLKLINFLPRDFNSPVFLSGVEGDENVTLNISVKTSDPQKVLLYLRKSLNSHGWDIAEENRILPILVITKKEE